MEREAEQALLAAGDDVARDVEERVGIELVVLEDPDPALLFQNEQPAVVGRRGREHRAARDLTELAHADRAA